MLKVLIRGDKAYTFTHVDLNSSYSFLIQIAIQNSSIRMFLGKNFPTGPNLVSIFMLLIMINAQEAQQ